MRKFAIIGCALLLSCSNNSQDEFIFLEPNAELAIQKIEDGQMQQDVTYPTTWSYENGNATVWVMVGTDAEGRKVQSESWVFNDLESADSTYIADFIMNYNYESSDCIIQIWSSIDSKFDYTTGDSQHFMISNFSLNSIKFDGWIYQERDGSINLEVTYNYLPE